MMERIPRNKLHKCYRCIHWERDYFGNSLKKCAKSCKAFEQFGKVKASEFRCDDFEEAT